MKSRSHFERVHTRRSFLGSSLAAGAALPLLPSLLSTSARAQALPPARYVVMFAGVSTGRGGVGDVLAPSSTGSGYALTPSLQPLAQHGIVPRTTVVSHLEIPAPNGSTVPAGARGRPWHSSSTGPLLSGRRALSASDRYSQLGPTSDQLVADTIGAGTRFRSLELKVQASGYRDETSAKRIMSYREGDERNEPITSPSLAYESLFTGFGSTDPVVSDEARRKLARDKSVVGLVRARAERLRARLGNDDRRRLERHYDELRALEGRLQSIDPTVDSLCRQLDGAPYANDPAVQSTLDQEICERVGANDPACEERVIGYAQETERGHLLSDLVHMSLVCDLSRVATVMLTHAQSFMSIADIVPSGVVTDAHECGHGTGTVDDFRHMLGWHVEQFSYLTQLLANTPEGDGTLLDRTVVVLVFEGGFGFDPETNDGAVPHSSENMNALIAGGEALGLHHGTHVDANGAHPAQVLLAGMRAVGHAGALGDITTPFAW